MACRMTLQELCKRVKERATVGQWSNKWKILAQQTAHVCASAKLTPEVDAEPCSLSDEGSDEEHPGSPSDSLGSDHDSAVEHEGDINFRSSHSGSSMEMSEEEDEHLPAFNKVQRDLRKDLGFRVITLFFSPSLVGAQSRSKLTAQATTYKRMLAWKLTTDSAFCVVPGFIVGQTLKARTGRSKQMSYLRQCFERTSIRVR